MKTINSQTSDILNHLKEGRAITQMKALRLFGCMRLGARIHNLREEGHNIKTTRVTRNGKSYAKYTLEK